MRVLPKTLLSPYQLGFSPNFYHPQCRTVCFTNPSNKDEGEQIFYSIRSQTKPIGIGANCEIPHNAAPTTQTYDLSSDITCQTVYFTNPSNDQLVKDEGAQIFYSIQSQTKPIDIGANCEIPHTQLTQLALI